jgi:hypothetical protein
MKLALGSWEFVQGIPRVAVSADKARPEGPISVLSFGEIPLTVSLALQARGVHVLKAKTTQEALFVLANTDVRSVAVDPQQEGAIELVKLVKVPGAKVAAKSENVWRAASRHRATPFVILPLPGDPQFAVIVAPPNGAFLERSLLVVTALLDLDASSLLPTPQKRN